MIFPTCQIFINERNYLRSSRSAASKIYVEESLQNFVGQQCHSELWTASADSRCRAFPEGFGA